jgi:hypothetical protein
MGFYLLLKWRNVAAWFTILFRSAAMVANWSYLLSELFVVLHSFQRLRHSVHFKSHWAQASRTIYKKVICPATGPPPKSNKRAGRYNVFGEPLEGQ